MSKEEKRYDIEDRLIDFAVRIIILAGSLPKTRIGSHIANQIIRSGTAPAPNYGEAQGAESRSDFIHKMKICLKELRETKVWLKMTMKANLIKPESKVEPLLNENDQLISIFVTSIKTSKSKNQKTS
ncbi:MAG: four helix bundle protein [Desulfobacterales bacterium]|nr:four helix bundle protein [Desulfobacterales bacterium]